MNISTFVWIVLGHFFFSLFLHSFFLHRYATHGQFTMHPGWEKFFYILTWLMQGPSFLDPIAYAKMHLEHHAHSDQELDPHSPLNFSKSKNGADFLSAAPKMMWTAKVVFVEIRKGTHRIAQLYRERQFPRWPEFQAFANSRFAMLFMALVFIGFYAAFAPVWWCWFFLPLTLLNGPIQGGIVNWCGHMWGYSNFDNDDNSKNTWILSTVMLGELYQNNHHKYPDSPNFAARWYELDPIYWIILGLHSVRIIRLKK
jgi:stearoyl-CoA desaturase (Delta-9 desaturase)